MIASLPPRASSRVAALVSVNVARSGLVLALTMLALAGFATSAQAKDEFPGQIERDVSGMTYQVPCSVCHIKGNTGASTPIMPFALSLRSHGLSGDVASLQTALTAIDQAGTDSDGDGTPDIQELIAGTDPNSSANASIVNDSEPGYGCGGSAPTGHGGPGLAAGLGITCLLLRRRRAPKGPRA